MEKRIYSLNLIAYVAMRTNLTPTIGRDENGVFYATFPEVRGVAYAIRDWKNNKCNVEIHTFLNEYKDLRERISKIRKEG